MTAVLLGALASPASAENDGPVVFTVDSVEDLYAAVSVPGAIVNVLPGGYLLDPALDQTAPNDGRLDLADGVDLRGPSRLSAGPHGLPNIDETGGPVLLDMGEPAVIDGSNLPPDTFGAGVIVVGHKGTVRDMWVRGSVDPASPDPSAGFLGRPGIEITSRGVVTGNVVERTTIGVRVRSGSGESVTGTVTGNFVMDSGLMGVVAIPVGVDDTFTSGSTITASFRANRIVRTSFNGILIVGGLSGDDNVVTVRTSDNVVQYASLGMFVETRGGGGLDPDPSDIRGASRNTVTFTSTRDSFESVAGGYLISGAIREYLVDPGGGPPLIGDESNDNTIVGTIQKASIQNAFFFDIIAEAATTALFPPPDDAPVSGSGNVVTLTLNGVQGSGNPFNVFVADSTPGAPGSGNDAVIIGSREHNEETNTGLDFSLVADSDFSR
jgi:hypothetical protein